MQISKYSDLIAWQRAVDFAVAVYRCTEKFPREESFGLTAQLRSSAVSVPSNIAEGHDQLTTKIYIRHLGVSRGSLAEAETQIQIAVRLGFLQDSQSRDLLRMSSEIGRLINGILSALRQKCRRPPP